MNDPVAILLIVVLVGAAVALWMLDGTYRSRLLKTSKRASDAEEKSTKLAETIAELRGERDKNRLRLERMEKDRDHDREQMRKLKAKVKRQGQAKNDSSPLANEDSQEVQRLTAELKVLRDELENRLHDDADHQQQIEHLHDQLSQARDRLDVFEAQAKKMSRGVRVSLVDSDVEAAKEDLPGFMKRIKTEMAILERKVRRNHEAFLSQQGKTDVAVEKLKAMRDRYRAVCRELAVLISGNQNMDEQEAQAVAEGAIEQADDGWSIGEVAASWADSGNGDEQVASEAEVSESVTAEDKEQTSDAPNDEENVSTDSDVASEAAEAQDEPAEVEVLETDNAQSEPSVEANNEADEPSDNESGDEKVAAEG